jgi:hypothetical protein
VLSDENFDPTRLVNRSVEAKLELCAWAPGVPATVLSSDGQTLSVDVQGAVLKFVYDGFDVVTLADTPMPTVVPRLSWGIFRIVQNGGVALHLGYSAFLTDLEGRLSTAEIVRVAALGTCDATTQEFSANVLTVVLR